MDTAQRAPASGRHARQGVAAAAAMVLVLGGMLFFARQSVRDTNNMRAHAEMQMLRGMAVACARMLDERADGLGTLVLDASRSQELALACQERSATRAGRELDRLAAGQPLGSGLALYGPDGVRLAESGEVPSLDMPGQDWLKASLKGANRRCAGFPTTGGGGVLVSAAPVRVDTRQTWGLAAWCSVSLDAGALHTDLASANVAIVVADAHSGLIGIAGAREELGEAEGPYDEPVRMAEKGESGATVVYPREHDRRKLVGYAAARQAGLVVLAAQLSERALAPTRFLVARLIDMVLPTIALVALAGWVLLSFYYRERQLSGTLAEHNRQLAAAAQAESDFLANVSHDLRTPLAALRVSIASLLDPEMHWTETAARDMLYTAREQVEQLNGRVRNLLEMSRIEAGAAPLRKDTCDLTDVVDCAVERVRPLLRGRTIHRDFPAEPIFVECDQVQIETVVVNLLENAVKYSPAGSALYLSGALQHPSAVLRVGDEGPGVPNGEEDRIFEKFYRANPTGPAGGIGLGLAICRSIVDRHGGSIGVHNRQEGGAEFVVSLPAPVIDMSVPGGMEIPR